MLDLITTFEGEKDLSKYKMPVYVRKLQTFHLIIDFCTNPLWNNITVVTIIIQLVK